MNPAPNQPDPNRRDPLGAYAYADGARGAVAAARPDEPSEARWEEVRWGIHDRLTAARSPERAGDRVGGDRPPERSGRRWRASVLLTGGAALAAVAAALAWVGLVPLLPPGGAPSVRSVPPGLEQGADPLAEFSVLPMAGADDVDLHRVPGAGWLPVGSDPLPEVLVLATASDVELEAPDPAWPEVAPSPGDVPMIFAAKPR